MKFAGYGGNMKLGYLEGNAIYGFIEKYTICMQGY